MEQEKYNQLREQAKTKKDGVYSFKGNHYLVVGGQLRAYCDYFGNVCEIAYGFNIRKGKASDRFEGRNILKGYLKQFSNN